MSDLKSYFAKLTSGAQGSEEGKACALILFTDQDIQMNDQRLNNLAALTYNSKSCENIFAELEKAITPTENPWKTIYKALLLLHTIILYGSELAIDKAISLCKFVHPLQAYNSALVKKSFFSSGGTDYGAPVRATAAVITTILMKDENIRRARSEARTADLVPLGQAFEQHNPQQGLQMTYGQGLNSSVGAGFGLEAVPGMYEGRPDRYFDNESDIRNRNTTGNHQLTRDVGYDMALLYIHYAMC
ncbi:hypothetical protein EON64_16940 [archaeon]|nr:MAG: hypothetical protein EON64_16940 [archaeon]